VPLKVVLYSPAHKQLTHSVWPPSECPRLRFNFRIIIILLYVHNFNCENSHFVSTLAK